MRVLIIDYLCQRRTVCRGLGLPSLLLDINFKLILLPEGIIQQHLYLYHQEDCLDKRANHPHLFYFFVFVVKVCQDGAWVENKGVLLTYHYREVPVEKRSNLVDRARELIAKFGFKVSFFFCINVRIIQAWI